jgi:hypothetical protein
MDWDDPPGKDIKVKPEQKVYEMEIGKKQEPSKKKINTKMVAVVAVVSVVLLISAFVVRPAVIGYSVYKQAENGNFSVTELGSNVEDLKFQLESTKANLSLYTEVYDQVWDEVRTTSSDLTKCLSEKESVNFKVETVRQQWKDDVEECEDAEDERVEELNRQIIAKDKEIADAKEDLLDLQKDFDKFVANLAKSVCCKAKVDNPSINSYEISRDRLLCLEDGENSLSC